MLVAWLGSMLAKWYDAEAEAAYAEYDERHREDEDDLEDTSGDSRDVDDGGFYPQDPEPEPWTPSSRYS